MRQKYWFYPFGTAGDTTEIPDPTQLSGEVSNQSGWTFDYERDLTGGTPDPLAKPIDRQTMNWLFWKITEQLLQYQDNGFPEWNGTTNPDSTAHAYDFGAVVKYSSSGNPPFVTYISVLAGVGTNSSVPGADANWQPFIAAKNAIQLLIQQLSSNYGIDTGTANAYVFALTPAITSYTPGMPFSFKALTTSTGSSTIDWGGGVVDLRNNANGPIGAGDIVAGTVYQGIYDSVSGTARVFNMLPSQVISSSTPRYSNYRAVSVGINNNSVVITCDSVDLVNSAGQIYTAKNVSLTINSAGTVGAPLSIMSSKVASTIYYLWIWRSAMVNSGNPTATLDISRTAPTAPTGYVSTDYRARMPGFALTDDTSDKYLMQIATAGDLTTYRPLTGSNTPALPLIHSGILGSLTAVDWRGYAPPTQRELILRVGGGGSRNMILVAPNSGYTDIYGINPCPIILDRQSTSEDVRQSVIQSIITESNNIYVMASGAISYVSVFGCRDNI